MKLWTRPECYIGADWPDHYVFLGQHRDSDAVSRTNFQAALKALGGESETVLVIRESHWAVGWIEWIGIHREDLKAKAIAEGLEKRLANYPVLDEELLSETEWNEAAEFWERSSVADRVEFLQRSGSTASIFAARRPELPLDDNGGLLDYLRG